MRRLLLTMSTLMLLACAGLSEKLLEEVTGADVEIREDGIRLGLPGGGTVDFTVGENAVHDPALTLSAPDGTIVMSGVITMPEQPDSYLAVYGAEEARPELVERYRQELSSQGLTIDESTSEDGSTILQGSDGERAYLVVVGSPSEGSDGATVSLGVGSHQALQQGLEASPQ